MDLLADLEARGLVHESTDRAALAARLAPASRTDHPLLRVRPDGRQPAPRQPDRAGDAAPVPGRRAPADRAGRRGDRHDRRPERAVRGAQPARRRRRSTTTSPRSRTSSAASSTSPVAVGRLVDNRDWTQPITLLEFLRDVGKHATVNQMVARESRAGRAWSREQGISYTEFSYMLLQANDYLWLHDHLGCELQIGGSDQWGNIISGVDLIRRTRQRRRARAVVAAAHGGRRHQARQDDGRPVVARPGQDVAVPVPPALGAARRRRGGAAAPDVLAAPAGRDRRARWPSTPRRPSGGWRSGRWPTRSPRSCTARRPPPPPRPPTCCSAATR